MKERSDWKRAPPRRQPPLTYSRKQASHDIVNFTPSLSRCAMATSNLGRFFKERSLHSSDRQVRHRPACGGSHRALRVAHEESLSPVYRLKANISLADGVDDWFLAERYRLAAEDTYNGISELVAEFATGDEEGRELAVLRETLDSLADDQRRSKPSQREITEASDTQRSVITTSRATESTASPTDGHAPIAEAQGSQAKLAYRRDLEQSEPSANAEGQQPK